MAKTSIVSKDFYKFLGPRPTVCVSTITEDKAPNLAPFSFVTPLSFEPPLLGVSVGKGKDTILNARATKEFVISPLTRKWMKKGIQSEIHLKRGENEFKKVSLTETKSKKVKPPSVGESSINIECKYHNDFEIGDHYLLVGEVINIKADEESVKDGRINLEKLGGVGHITGDDFSIAENVTKIKRK